MEISALKDRGFNMEQLYALTNQSRQNIAQGSRELVVGMSY